MDDSYIDYGKLIDRAMRSIVKETLTLISKEGLQGDHHFYITFYTDFPGVKIAEELKAEYDEEMTIVLQHQFWDMEIKDDLFSVTLSFKHKKQNLVIPYAAITAFADPSVKFGLQFRQMEEELADMSGSKPTKKGKKSEGDSDEKPADGAKVISLDSFRKK